MQNRLFLLGVLAVAAIVFVVWSAADDELNRSAGPTACGQTQLEPRELGVERTAELTLCLLNEERRMRDLPPLRQNALLAQAALAHSQDMVQRGFFEHDTPDGVTPQDRILRTGYVTGRGKATGENLAWGEGFRASPGEIVEGWMRSPGHKRNILRPSFQEIGFGIVLEVPAVVGGDEQGATYTTTFGGAL